MRWADDTPWIDGHPTHTVSFFLCLTIKDLMDIRYAGLLLTHIEHSAQLEQVSQ